MGVMEATFSERGTKPEEREALTVFVMSGVRVGRQSLRRAVGRGSREQVEDFIPATTDERSDGEMSRNVEKESEGGARGGVRLRSGGGEMVSWLWMVDILSWKNERKLLHYIMHMTL